MVPGGHGAGVDYLEHDVHAARNDELAGLFKVEAAVVDEHLAAVLGAHRAAEFGVGSRAATDGLAIRHRSQSLPADRRPLRGDSGRSSPSRGGGGYARARAEVKTAARLSDLALSNLAQDPLPNLH